MARIHSITLKARNILVESKLNFFSDYFSFAIDYMGLLDDIPLENHLSIVDKIISQIQENLPNSVPYLDNYFSSTYLKDDLVKEFEISKDIFGYINVYTQLRKPKDKIEWIKNNPNFILCWKKLRDELSANLYRKSLDAILSFMGCPHDLGTHLNEIKYYTNILVSELIFKEFPKSYIQNSFNGIIYKDEYTFLFPEHIKSTDERTNYLENITLNEQLESLWHLYNKESNETFFLLRIQNIQASESFEFTYNRVTFYNNHHTKIDKVKLEMKEQILPDMADNFFQVDKNIIIATVKIETFSIEQALNKAIDLIKKELVFLNYMSQANAILDPFEYLTLSEDFTLDGWSVKLDKASEGKNIEEKTKRLEDNPFSLMKDVFSEAKNHFLKFEEAFIQALSSKRISDYWQYLENLIQSSLLTKDKVVKDYLSSILLLNIDSYQENQLLRYTLNAISPLITSSESIGIEKERQRSIYSKPREQSLESLSMEINHPFINHSIDFFYQKEKSYNKYKKHYFNLLTEAYEQRNFYVHHGYEHPKASIKLKVTLPRLTTRFRWLLLEEISKHPDSDFKHILNSLKNKGDRLGNEKSSHVNMNINA